MWKRVDLGVRRRRLGKKKVKSSKKTQEKTTADRWDNTSRGTQGRLIKILTDRHDLADGGTDAIGHGAAG